MKYLAASISVVGVMWTTAYAHMPRMSPEAKATFYCKGKTATFPPLEATVECLYVKHVSGNKYAVYVEKLN